jgi:hypothetical protein
MAYLLLGELRGSLSFRRPVRASALADQVSGEPRQVGVNLKLSRCIISPDLASKWIRTGKTWASQTPGKNAAAVPPTLKSDTL